MYDGSGRGNRGGAPHIALVVAGILVTYALVGVVAIPAERSGVLEDGYRRAAYWACVDLLEQRVGPAVSLTVPGDSRATVVQSGASWEVAAWADVEGSAGETRRTWTCTVHHDAGNWRGTAALE